MGKFISKVTDAIGISDYSGQAKATKNATRQQLESNQAQLNYQKEADALAAQRLQPFVNIGTGAAPAYQSLLTSQGQMDYLSNNPMFAAAIKSSSDQLKGSAAASGKYNSGGLVNQLFQNYLGTGDAMVGNQYNRLANAVGIGQASAAGQAANSLNSANNITGILGNRGDIQSAGTMAKYNASQAALQGGLNTWNNIWSGNGIMGEGSIPGMGPINQIGGGLSSFGPFMQGLGGLMGGGAMGGGAMAMSDRRAKTDIVEIDRDEVGGIYEFRYKGDNRKFVGRMADELKKTRPDAVREVNGYLMVTSEFAPRAA